MARSLARAGARAQPDRNGGGCTLETSGGGDPSWCGSSEFTDETCPDGCEPCSTCSDRDEAALPTGARAAPDACAPYPLDYPSSIGIDRQQGAAFEDEDVVRCYAHRAPYAPALFPLLAELAPANTAALDLGCGPGKLARGLADHFERVDGVDPSRAMIEVARRHAPSVRFQQARAETAELNGPYDLVVAGMAMHWMDHDVVFGRLRQAVRPGTVLAFVEGDSAHEPPWEEAWRTMIHRWLRRVGKEPDEPGYARDLYAHEAYVELAGRRQLCFDHRQRLEDVIEREHSRATWARAAMGKTLAAALDCDMRAILEPYCNAAGELRFTVCTNLAWGVLREPG